MQRASKLVLMACMLAQAGCSSSSPPKPVYVTTGRVLYNGYPLANAKVVFYPVDRAALPRETPSGMTDAQGNFTISTYGKNDGAPTGQYRVAILQAAAQASGSFPVTYVDPGRSGLKAQVNAAATKLPDFQLQGPALRL